MVHQEPGNVNVCYSRYQVGVNVGYNGCQVGVNLWHNRYQGV